jgi:regulator of protease activity HflC (stomatin/prohibitin superfamily)
MENGILGALLIVSVIMLYFLYALKLVIIFEYERGLLFKGGRYARLLEPGSHWYLRSRHQIRRIDIRSQHIAIPGQEVLSADNVGLKISLVCSCRVVDPYQAIVANQNFLQAVYTELQVNLRDLVGETPIDELLEKRKELGAELLARAKDRVTEFGVCLEAVAIKDIMFPGDLKRIFAQVVNARKEGVAALERARGESAALRNLANTANLLEKNPGLLQLRLLQALDSNPGNTIILGDISETTTKRLLENPAVGQQKE